MSDPEIVSVTGGVGGIEARYGDIERLAALFDRVGDGLRHDAWEDKGVLAEGDLLESAILSPLTFAAAESDVVAATLGPHGLAVRALGLEADALSMQVAVSLLRAGDDLARQAFEVLDYAGGYVVGASLPVLLLGGAAAGTALLITQPGLAAYLATHPHERAALTEAALGGAQGFLEDHPDLVQHLLNGGGGLLDGLTGDLSPGARAVLMGELGIDPVHPTTNGAAGDLAGLFSDSAPRVTPGVAEPRQLATPGTLEDLVSNLADTNSGADGEIDIQQIGEGDGARFVVHLPGTDSWGTDAGDVRDLQANLQLVGGQDTAYTRGIAEAMRDAGVPSGAPVLLVGHSQGGMAAVHLAADPSFQEAYDVRHVVTAGSPTAQVAHVPAGTQVLSLENSGDVVPLADGEGNPDEPHRTTVRFDNRTGSLGGNHSLETYIRGAAAVDGSADPSLTAELEALRHDGFLGSTDPTSTRGYTITRDR